MSVKKAVVKINLNGILLVFPINNREEPKSLWSEFYPKTKMRWEWDDGGDHKVSDMWSLMKRLSTTQEVIYSKWYQGRATFFSIELFQSLLRILHDKSCTSKLSRPARNLLEALESDSPLSTKQLKKITELQGKDNEPTYNKAMKQLFSSLQIVGFGEVDDGAFPSLAVGATQLLYEDLWTKSLSMNLKEAQNRVDELMPQNSLTRKQWEKIILQFS